MAAGDARVDAAGGHAVGDLVEWDLPGLTSPVVGIVEQTWKGQVYVRPTEPSFRWTAWRSAFDVRAHAASQSPSGGPEVEGA